LTALLEVEGIHTAYGSSRVLFGITLDVQAGECVCLLGRNGVGKTTTMRSIMGLTPPSQGHVRFKGKEITGSEPYRLARSGIGYVPEDRRIFAELTVWENLEVAARSANRPGPWKVETVSGLFPKLGELGDRMGGLLSGGEQQMLTLARALGRSPRLLLADELSLGLAPLVVDRLLQAVRTAAKDRGTAVLMVDQHAHKALQYADRAIVMRRGRVQLALSGEEARRRIDEVEQAYLTGGSATQPPAPAPAAGNAHLP
jgi:branched-chain amino acid transport system ATP-binding protein